MLQQSATEMLVLIENLCARWSSSEVPYGPGATEDEIAEFESRYSVRLPDDLRLYFQQIGGMSDWNFDNNNLTFFPLRMVQSLSEFRGAIDGQTVSSIIDDPKRTFVIADFLISSHEYLIHLSMDRQSEPVLYYTSRWQQFPESKHEVAPSFAAFLQLYLTNPDALY